MNSIRKNLEKLRKVKRKLHHPLVHKMHIKHNISRKTLFYIKEYGPHSNVPKTIIKESIKILLLASVISSFGGLALERIKIILASIIPLIILLPALNNMIGDYGSIVSSRFSTMLHEGIPKKRIFANPELIKLFIQILIISAITAIFSSFIALFISFLSSRNLDFSLSYKIFLIAVVDVTVIIALLFITAVYAGIYIYNKQEDPNDFLIPITTSIGDFGNMILLALLVHLFF